MYCLFLVVICFKLLFLQVSKILQFDGADDEDVKPGPADVKRELDVKPDIVDGMDVLEGEEGGQPIELKAEDVKLEPTSTNQVSTTLNEI